MVGSAQADDVRLVGDRPAARPGQRLVRVGRDLAAAGHHARRWLSEHAPDQTHPLPLHPRAFAGDRA